LHCFISFKTKNSLLLDTRKTNQN